MKRISYLACNDTDTLLPQSGEARHRSQIARALGGPSEAAAAVGVAKNEIATHEPQTRYFLFDILKLHLGGAKTASKLQAIAGDLSCRTHCLLRICNDRQTNKPQVHS